MLHLLNEYRWVAKDSPWALHEEWQVCREASSKLSAGCKIHKYFIVRCGMFPLEMLPQSGYSSAERLCGQMKASDCLCWLSFKYILRCSKGACLYLNLTLPAIKGMNAMYFSGTSTTKQFPSAEKNLCLKIFVKTTMIETPLSENNKAKTRLNKRNTYYGVLSLIIQKKHQGINRRQKRW